MPAEIRGELQPRPARAQARHAGDEGVADQIGRSVDTISNIERGSNSTRVETAARIAEVLAVALPELFEFEAEPGPGRQRRREIGDLSRRLAGLDDRQFGLLVSLITAGLRLSEKSQ